MSRYNADDDPDCYPGTHVLKNKAGLTNQDDLDQFEQLMFLSRSEEELPEGNLDYAYYKSIHRHFFQDVYEWAGPTRTIRTGKGSSWFCYPEYIDARMESLFAELAAEYGLAVQASHQEFAERAAHYIAEINAVHPFREGNGRCQLTFLNLLMAANGYTMDENLIDTEKLMHAMVKSFYSDNGSLAAEIRTISAKSD